MFTLSTPPEKRSYHHRDLRQALIRSALEILSEAGVAALSLRAAARRAGVSAMAPYRHFADKEALLAAVAEFGFRELLARLTAATAAAADPRAGLAALGVAYVLFAREQPSLFKLMFGPMIEHKSGHPDLNEAGGACFNALRQAVAAAKFFDGDSDAGDVAWHAGPSPMASRH
jgi:AcrR family transcriptional regulator